MLDMVRTPVVDVIVVRDDCLACGSKSRFLDYLIGHAESYRGIREWVFGSSPATGYGQISLAHTCRRYGKTAVLFMAQRALTKLHPYQQRGLSEGACYEWVPQGRLSVTQARARRYAEAAPETRHVLPIGLEHPLVLAAIITVARSLPIVPSEVWSVGSSGLLNRGLQAAWPDASCHVVQVGHAMSIYELGRARHHQSRYRFEDDTPVRERPPFPSVVTYDAKGWQPMLDWYEEHAASGPILYWNVAG